MSVSYSHLSRNLGGTWLLGKIDTDAELDSSSPLVMAKSLAGAKTVCYLHVGSLLQPSSKSIPASSSAEPDCW
jgi:hypothetical protein